MKIYVVTEGEYSDYHIVGVTDDHEKAVALCEILGGDRWYDDVHVETYDTDAMDVDYGKMKPYSVDMWEDGRIEVGSVETVYGWDYERAIEREVQYCSSGFFKGNEYSVDVMARDEEHAKKIAIDLIAQYKYEKEVENEV